MDASSNFGLRTSGMYYFTANTGSTSSMRSPQRRRTQGHVLTEGIFPNAGINQASSTISTHRRIYSLPSDFRSGTLGTGSTTTSYETDVTRWTFQFPGTLCKMTISTYPYDIHCKQITMSFKNWARDVTCLLSRFRRRRLTKTVDDEVEEEARRLADVAAIIFNHPPESTTTFAPAPALAPTTMEDSLVSQAVTTAGEANVGEPSFSKVHVPPVVVTPTRECLICTEKYEGEEVLKIQFPFECGECNKILYCGSCIGKWFLDACRNESRMPPKCCYAIPVIAVSNLLDADQVNLFNLKHEEWMTADRVYCPVPSCSAFIPPRLLKAASKQNASPPTPPPENEIKQEAADVVSENIVDTVTPSKFTVCCPDCHTKICTACRAFSHAGKCAESDIDPELEAALERWKIKRCPKCRTGLRRMYGCNHVECHCGAHFCYACMLPYNECDGECGDDDGEDYDSVAEDDLDGKEDWGDGRNIGEEPMTDRTDIWGCRHRFRQMSTQNIQICHTECQRCYKSLVDFKRVTGQAQDTHVHESNTKGNEDIIMTGTGDAIEADRALASDGWTCACGRVICGECKELEEDND